MSLLDRKYWTRKLSKLRIYLNFLISFMSLLDRKYWTRKVKTPDKSSFSILFYEFTRWEIMNPAYRITAGSFSRHNVAHPLRTNQSEQHSLLVYNSTIGKKKFFFLNANQLCLIGKIAFKSHSFLLSMCIWWTVTKDETLMTTWTILNNMTIQTFGFVPFK